MVDLRDSSTKSRSAIPFLDLPRPPLPVKPASGQLLYKGERAVLRKEDRRGIFRLSPEANLPVDDPVHPIDSQHCFKATSAYRNLSYHGFTSQDHLDGKK
jgi:hypothetical protein